MTRAGKIIHSVALFIHNLFPIGKVNASEIQNLATEIASVANVYSEVRYEVAGIKDPAKIVEAVCVSFLKHESELPPHIRENKLDIYIVELCQKISGLPLDQIEAEVEAILHPKPAEPAA